MDSKIAADGGFDSGRRAIARGCDEHVEIIRNRDIPVLKHQLGPGGLHPPERRKENGRPVVSRDVIEAVKRWRRKRIPPMKLSGKSFAQPIERQLTAKGLTQVSDGSGGFPGGLSFADAPPQCECGAHLSPGAIPVGVRPVWMLARMGLRAR